MKKILILYSTGGMGHKKAASALFESFKKHADKVVVKNIDTLDYGNKFYKFLYMNCYVFLMTKGKALWGFLYYFSDIGIIDKIMKKVREVLDIKSMKGLEELLMKENPDAIVSTHFVLSAIAKIVKTRINHRVKQYVVITDYGPHGFWIADDIDRYFVGSESMVPDLLKRGIPQNKITVTGIPVVEDFKQTFDVPGLREKYGLTKDKKTIFMLSGGFGVGPMAEMLKNLDNCKSDIQVITVCGHNEELHKNIDAMKNTLKYPITLLGFTDKVPELMAVSDLMITKAGGISVTEALVMKLPMILYASIPGQETWNEQMLVGAQAAMKADSVEKLSELADRALLSVDVYESLKAGIETVRHDDSAEEIVESVLGEIEEE